MAAAVPPLDNLHNQDRGARPDMMPEMHTQGQERPFFDANNLPDVKDIDLTYLNECRRVDFNPGAPTVNVPKALRFILEASDGYIEDETQYKGLEERAIGEVLGGNIDGEKLGWLYEHLETLHPRVPELMQRIRREKIFADQEFITLSKLAMVATVYRFEH